MTRSNEGKVDMFTVARTAQAVDTAPFNVPGALKLVAPAKVNLYLEIGAKRPDGYHEVTTVMHALLLHDVLRMKRVSGDAGRPNEVVPEGGAGPRVALTCRSVEGVPSVEVAPADNIVTKAVLQLAAAVGRCDDETIIIDLEKHIPAEAGLGGGSSDAAAALLGVAKLWGLGADDERVEAVARTLGADVAFFLHGGCSCLSGAGDEFSHALEPLRSCVVLLKPAGGVSTAASYRAFDDDPVTISAADHERALSAACAQDVPLRNNMEPASEGLLPVIAEVRTWAQGQPGVSSVLMSGSGSALFACCDSLNAATDLVSAAQANGWWARSTMFGPARAAIVPRR